jgi:hypothetical protein
VLTSSNFLARIRQALPKRNDSTSTSNGGADSPSELNSANVSHSPTVFPFNSPPSRSISSDQSKKNLLRTTFRNISYTSSVAESPTSSPNQLPQNDSLASMDSPLASEHTEMAHTDSPLDSAIPAHADLITSTAIEHEPTMTPPVDPLRLSKARNRSLSWQNSIQGGFPPTMLSNSSQLSDHEGLAISDSNLVDTIELVRDLRRPSTTVSSSSLEDIDDSKSNDAGHSDSQKSRRGSQYDIKNGDIRSSDANSFGTIVHIKDVSQLLPLNETLARDYTYGFVGKFIFKLLIYNNLDYLELTQYLYAH